VNTKAATAAPPSASAARISGAPSATLIAALEEVALEQVLGQSMVQSLYQPIVEIDFGARGRAGRPGRREHAPSPDSRRETGARRIEDHVGLNGVDRWIGGVHLTGRAVRWRWDEGTESIAPVTADAGVA